MKTLSMDARARIFPAGFVLHTACASDVPRPAHETERAGWTQSSFGSVLPILQAAHRCRSGWRQSAAWDCAPPGTMHPHVSLCIKDAAWRGVRQDGAS